MARRPRAKDVGPFDAGDRPQLVGEDRRYPEGSRENVREADVVGAIDVCPHHPDVANLPTGDDASRLGPLDLSVDRWERSLGSIGDLRQAELQLRISEQQRQDRCLLLRSKNRKKGRRTN